jgi:siroheme decarboxylase
MAKEPTSLDDQDRAVLRLVQDDLPDSATPFADIAKATGATEARVLDLLGGLAASGAIRRFGATLRHQQAGYQANVMVAWRVPEDDVDRLGPVMAERPEVSHCYHRRTCPEWPYNLYTMVHGRTAEACLAVVASLSRETGVTDYALLPSLQELKKSSMRYF